MNFTDKLVERLLDRFGPVKSESILIAMRDHTTGEDFVSHISVDKDTECWVWTGAVNSRSYGIFEVEGREELAHQVSWVMTMGLIGGGLCLRHTCGNRLCCNPDHMFLDTKKGVV